MIAVAFVLAAGCGALARSEVAGRLNRRGLPVGTLVVNLTGSLVLGLLAGATDSVALIAGTGALAGYTTFSSFARDTVDLAVDLKLPLRSAAYVLATIVGSVGAALLGLLIST